MFHWSQPRPQWVPRRGSLTAVDSAGAPVATSSVPVAPTQKHHSETYKEQQRETESEREKNDK